MSEEQAEYGKNKSPIIPFDNIVSNNMAHNIPKDSVLSLFNLRSNIQNSILNLEYYAGFNLDKKTITFLRDIVSKIDEYLYSTIVNNINIVWMNENHTFHIIPFDTNWKEKVIALYLNDKGGLLTIKHTATDVYLYELQGCDDSDIFVKDLNNIEKELLQIVNKK